MPDAQFTAMALRLSKIRPPRPGAETLARPRLVERARTALGRCRLLLLRAPAGCGKTTLLAALASSLPVGECAWVNVDAGDDLEVLLEALIGALEGADLPWRESPRAWVAAAADSDDFEALADTLAQALDASEHRCGLIVLDDWHRCSDARAARWLDAFLDLLPTPWTLAIGTRDEPQALSLARRRARGEVAEVTRADLSFSTAEIGAWARTVGWRDLQAVQRLARRTEGWAAALRLAFTAGGDSRALSLAEADMFDFVASEVVDRLPADLRRFLLRCAVLPELSASRCAAVSGQADAARHLEQLRRRDLFVIEADERGTLRLHELFRQALLHQLERDEPGVLPTLLRRAAQGERDAARRVRWLLEAGDAAAAAAELEAVSAALITDGAGQRVAEALRGFDDSALATWPRLAIVQARLAWSRWDFDTMLRVLERVPVRALDDCPNEVRDVFEGYLVVALDSAHRVQPRDRLIRALQARPLAPLPRLLVMVTLLEAPRNEADVARIAQHLHDTALLADGIGTATAWHQALPPPYLLMLPGTLDTVQHTAAAMRALAGSEPNTLRAWSALLQSWVDLWRGNAAAAFEALEQAEDDAAWDDARSPVLTEVYRLRALLCALRSDATAAWQAIERSVALIPAAAFPGAARTLAASIAFERRARVAIMLGDAAALQRALTGLPSPGLEGESPSVHRLRQVAGGALEAMRGSWGEACRIWTAAQPDWPMLEGQGLAGELRLRLAAAQIQRGEISAAARALEPLLAARHAAHGLGPALFAGIGVLQTLGQVDQRAWPDPGWHTTLQHWRAIAQREAVLPMPQVDATHLTEREFTVLSRIARGDSNKQIARQLDLSPHTVKRHVAHILDKLDLRSRGQAAAWFHRERPSH